MGTRWAVLIGINGYHESLEKLKFCANDANVMQKMIMRARTSIRYVPLPRTRCRLTACRSIT